jgi:hypothetical protein
MQSDLQHPRILCGRVAQRPGRRRKVDSYKEEIGWTDKNERWHGLGVCMMLGSVEIDVSGEILEFGELKESECWTTLAAGAFDMGSSRRGRRSSLFNFLGHIFNICMHEVSSF